ncbi:MAG TPA: hypothetical protein VN969_40960, partial [Streptosporangiaceae bacterium]|nr:hypothetical protein [Streptosporangiaceae bacterium]
LRSTTHSALSPTRSSPSLCLRRCVKPSPTAGPQLKHPRSDLACCQPAAAAIRGSPISRAAMSVASVPPEMTAGLLWDNGH